ncbi:Potassium efflux system KefA protein / Small-conductance mechanosensitive channel [Olavius algarvensis associated proteobacterium Delta 3]|nr:Potassium efflux system KefA protein / Small-conductance mechanosensitive channel [Olavius algarvensis associated proteobacterium Delta 3]
MTSLNQFWELMVDVWKNGVAGIDLGRIIVAALIFIGFLLIRRIFVKLITGRLKSLSKRTPSEFDDRALDVLERPLGFIPVVLGLFFAFKFLSLSGALDSFADKVIRSLVVFVLFWSLIRLVEPLSRFIKKFEDVLTVSIVEWLVKAVRITFLFIAIATILEIWGIRIGPIIAGLGLFGVAVALGAQDLFKNLISGLSILAEQRFHIGDWIYVDGVVEGTVESIGFRSTRVRRFDKAPVYVPNSKLSDNPVTNFSSMTHRRIYWTIGVEYRTTVDQLRRIRDGIENYILTSDAFAKPPEVSTFVRIDRFNDSSIDILVYCFTKTTVWGEWLEEKEKLAFRVKEIVTSAGTGFAFPSRSVYVETLPTETPEVFVPPSNDQ